MVSGMTALVLSVVALAVSVVSAVFVGVSALATRGLQKIERGRRLDERRPRMTGRIERRSHDRHPLIWWLSITLLSEETLYRAVVEIPRFYDRDFDVSFVNFTDDPYDVPERVGSGEKQEINYLTPRHPVYWPVCVTSDPVPFYLKATCYGFRGEVWHSVHIDIRWDKPT
jgi:hypothetical protein